MLSEECYECDDCGLPYRSLSHHYYSYPDCCPPELVDGDSDDEEEPIPPAVSELSAHIARDTIREEAAASLADLRFEHGLQEPTLRAVKAFVVQSLSAQAERAAIALAPLLREGTTPTDVQCALETGSFFQGIETARLEATAMRKGKPYLEPRTADLGDKAEVASFDLGDLIQRKLVHDGRYRRACMDKSTSWKRGDHWCKAPEPEDELTDFDDAVAARYHPHLMRTADSDEEQDLRIALDLNADDIEAGHTKGHAPMRISRSVACRPSQYVC